MKTKRSSKEIAKEAVDFVMKNYPITMERLRLEEIKDLEREEREAKYMTRIEARELEQKAISKGYGKIK